MTFARQGNELRIRRDKFGFALADVARMAELPIDRVAAIEDGAVPSTLELAQLAAALVIDPASILAGTDTEDDPRRGVARFRRNEMVETISARDVRLLSLAAEVGRIGEGLRQMLGLPKSAVDEVREVTAIEGHPGKQGYGLGAEARGKLTRGSAPIPSMQGLLESLGVHVAQVEFDDRHLEAAAIFETGALPVIVVNRAHSRARHPVARRALLAHELCHLLHDGLAREMVTVISRVGADDPVEQRANGFAPGFLAPEAMIDFDWAEPDASVVALADRWGLSFEGAVYHAYNLGKFNLQTREGLLAPRRPQIRFEEAFVERRVVADMAPSPMVDGLVADLAIQAQQADLISTGRLEEILSLS